METRCLRENSYFPRLLRGLKFRKMIITKKLDVINIGSGWLVKFINADNIKIDEGDVYAIWTTSIRNLSWSTLLLNYPLDGGLTLRQSVVFWGEGRAKAGTGGVNHSEFLLQMATLTSYRIVQKMAALMSFAIVFYMP